jgi:two-component system sensor kinase
VLVTVSEQQERLVLRIEDNGRGFEQPTAASVRSLGLLGMRERVNACAGDLEIQSAPGQGTTIVVKIPLRR